tara:strand:- start:421 stop:873 length:453 start_codon:yes stop_codon:yes gene_type:complete
LRVVSNKNLALPEWFVVFCNPDKPTFWQKMLKNNFRHCWAFTYDPKSDVWILIEPTWGSIHIRAFKPNDFTPFLVQAGTTGKVLAVPVKTKPVYKCRLFMHCVSVICHLTGVDLLVATPYRLFCELTKRGCIEKFTITKETPHHGKLKPV